MRIAINKARSFFRHRNKLVSLARRVAVDDKDDKIEDLVLKKQEVEALHAAISDLPEDFQLVFFEVQKRVAREAHCIYPGMLQQTHHVHVGDAADHLAARCSRMPGRTGSSLPGKVALGVYFMPVTRSF